MAGKTGAIMKVSPQIRTELLKRFPNSVAEIGTYIRLMKDAPVPTAADNFHGYHLLPRGWFPQFADFRLYPWNCRVLSASHHQQAHRLLDRVGDLRLYSEKRSRSAGRTNLYLSVESRAVFIAEARKKGISMAELIRRVLDRYVRRLAKK